MTLGKIFEMDEKLRVNSSLTLNILNSLTSSIYSIKNIQKIKSKILDRHHRPDDFGRNQTPANELQVYTWMDATLKEITNLVKEVHPESRKKGMIFDFAICYQVINFQAKSQAEKYILLAV